MISLFYKRILHTKDGVIPQYCNKEGSYLKVIPHNGNLDSELHTHNFYLILFLDYINEIFMFYLFVF